ncbi:hypothetical protein ACFYPK_24315 [Streptomyces halstedii]|uniref:effector-associated constant component EACC1 n=1 Tax=Streptomyces TaxID=1883 RepID=UPI00099789CC|nr:hypothetical protein [Streptomyces sp. NTK 937]WSX37648.1 hypothetical protein OG291_19340 [Streptomyces halstedii]
MTTGRELALRPGSTRFDPEDQAWHDQVATLYAALREEVETVGRSDAPTPGYKGAVEATLLAVGSSGALTAAVACFKAWLARDRTRTLTVTWTDSTGAEQRFHVTGDNIDLQTLTKALERDS